MNWSSSNKTATLIPNTTVSGNYDDPRDTTSDRFFVPGKKRNAVNTGVYAIVKYNCDKNVKKLWRNHV